VWVRAKDTGCREGEGEKEIKTDDAHYAHYVPTYLPTYPVIISLKNVMDSLIVA